MNDFILAPRSILPIYHIYSDIVDFKGGVKCLADVTVVDRVMLLEKHVVPSAVGAIEFRVIKGLGLVHGQLSEGVQ